MQHPASLGHSDYLGGHQIEKHQIDFNIQKFPVTNFRDWELKL